jgi:hypothetical protein
MARSSPAVLLLLAALAGVAAAGDIVHQDDEAPKIPGCNNDFVLVRLSFRPPPLLVQLLCRLDSSTDPCAGLGPSLGRHLNFGYGCLD